MNPAGSAERLARFRERLGEMRLDGFIVPKADAHQSEIPPPSEDRLPWLTGFTGSAGTAIVLPDRAVLFVDGRYTLQAGMQVDAFEVVPIADTTPTAWLKDALAPGTRLGFDPWHLTVTQVARFREVASDTGAELVAASTNPIDDLWDDRPAPPLTSVEIRPPELAGRTVSDKLDDLRSALADMRADATVLTQGDSVAWAFNIRARDLTHTPVPLAFAVIHREGRPELFIDSRKLTGSVNNRLEAEIDVRAADALPDRLTQLGGKTVLVDESATAQAIADAIDSAGGHRSAGDDPVTALRARKNSAELAGTRTAHRRDGAAMVRFLAWLDREAAGGNVDEIAAAETLRSLRADTAVQDGSELICDAFDTISGAGPNGAIVHYRVTPKTARSLEDGSLYLVDSGGQYRDGTTDITRTVAIGAPDTTMRDRYTRVLKGHVALSRAVFPVGTSGAQLDVLARQPLWEAGLDYAHGTGHGVGAFLSVHEGPAGFSKRATATLEPGMLISNEPGYYREGNWGIRIENLVVVEAAADVPGGDLPMHRFETVTLCPYDRRLIDVALLDPAEIAWIDSYHARLGEVLADLLDEDERCWLAAATAPLDRFA